MKENYRAQIESIRSEFLHGHITLDEAKTKVEPILKEMNDRGEKLAKEFGMKFKKFTFSYIFR